MLKHRIVIRIETPQFRAARVICSNMCKVGMQKGASMALGAFMLMHMRKRRLQERQEQERDHAGSEYSKTHQILILDAQRSNPPGRPLDDDRYFKNRRVFILPLHLYIAAADC
jgi:hypothetical protein